MLKHKKVFIAKINKTNHREKTLYAGVGLCALGYIDKPDWYLCICFGFVLFYATVGVRVPFANRLIHEKPACYYNDTGSGKCNGMIDDDVVGRIYTSECDGCHFRGRAK